MNNIYVKLYKTAKKLYLNENTGHDFGHIKRCLKYAKAIQENEGGDWFIIYTSVLFHDIHRVMSTNEKGYISATDSIPYIKNILNKFNIEKNELNKILENIELHDNKNLTDDISIELKILQDADIIDALGKRGLKRTLKYCKTRNIPLFNKSYSLDHKSYIPNIFPISTTHYVYRTMLPEAKLIKTPTGKIIAEKKTAILQKFIDKNIKKHSK